ncbi:MAG: large conductance mechanosensitive channel protein MscL [Lachnospiraceae bacterium]|nr:large conductance mechanosensitive channel protein MscL [Lachnospiraceae bacterium]
MFKEFKKFIMRGNMIDLAVGMIIGASFSAIITSLVNNILMPVIGVLTGGKANFTDAFIVLNEVKDELGNKLPCPATLDEAEAAGFICLGYGAFITALISFLLVAICLFFVIKAFNKAQSLTKKEEAPAAPTTKVCPFCKSEISIEATRCPHCTSELPKEE